MLEFKEPAPCLVKQAQGAPKPLPLYSYVLEVILALPYYRSTLEAAREGDELLEHCDKLETLADAGQPTQGYLWSLRDETQAHLLTQMSLADSQLVQLNPALVRPSIRYKRVVGGAVKPAESQTTPEDK